MAKIIAWCMAGLIILVLVWGIGFGFRYTSKIINPDNILNSQEMFEEMNQSITRQKGTIISYQEVYELAPDQTNLQILVAAKNKLRSLVADYNAKARSTKRSLWRSSTLPYQFDAEEIINNLSKKQ